MPKRLGKFELPNKLTKVEEGSSPTYAKFIAEPFEAGYGHTVGNSLRRVLLSSIEGAAISSIKIENVQHEFQSIEGIVEDVTDVVLNLKKILIISQKREPVRLTIKASREGPVTAADIQPDAAMQIVNPEQLICTLDKNRPFEAEIEIKTGRGYCPGENNKKEEQPIGVIPIDSLFSPVRLVRYTVENTRVGQMTNYDKLTLEIETDGTVTPEDALAKSADILVRQFALFANVGTAAIAASPAGGVPQIPANMLEMPIEELDLPMRAYNSLKRNNIVKVGQLLQLSDDDLLRMRNFGKKSLDEMKERLRMRGFLVPDADSSELVGVVEDGDEPFGDESEEV